MRLITLSATAFLLAQAACADDKLDCKDPQDQMSLNFCAANDAADADKALNAIWPKIKADAISNDKDTGKHEYIDTLMASQRAWLAYRKTQCKWNGFQAHGGSMEPMLYSGCLARLTKARIKELQESLAN